jgi:hypothetical protein
MKTPGQFLKESLQAGARADETEERFFARVASRIMAIGPSLRRDISEGEVQCPAIK